MSLAEYRRKRDFGRTAEPRSDAKAERRKKSSFVVQLHHARRRHYDFRLQVDGVLKSWAIPKGPSFDPRVKRLAIQTEDHPLAYAEFEGDIPQGEYGGGHVQRFDHGTWSTREAAAAQLRKGHLRFTLHGRKLRGGWDLIRTAKPGRKAQWLLVKQDDEHAGPTEADDLVRAAEGAAERQSAGSGNSRPPTGSGAAPQRPALDADALLALRGAKRSPALRAPWPPELASLVDAPPSGEGWLHEVKWDGYRLLALRSGKAVSLWSRNGLPWTERLPEIASALKQVRATEFALDGELVQRTDRHSDFNRLQSALAEGRSAALTYVVFDLLHCHGVDLRRVALQERKRALRRLLDAAPAPLAYSTHHRGDGLRVFAAARRAGLEGIVSKLAGSAYEPGRGDAWRKCKVVQGDEFLVFGWTPPRGARQHVGSLLLAAPTRSGGWRYAGRVGSGFSEALLRRLGSLLPALERDTPFTAAPRVAGARWIEPELIAEVDYRAITRDGLLRQASLHGLREDKTMNDLKLDAERTKPAKSAAASGRRRATTTRRSATAGPVKVTHPERIVYPASGITKSEVADYYAAVAPRLLREAARRPLSVVRCPDGVEKACFFQKHEEAALGDAVRGTKIKEQSGKAAHYFYIDSARGLAQLVQMNTIELHLWGSRVDEPDRCDRLVFDLDPGAGVAWKRIVTAARDVRASLRKISLRSWLRVSGGKGLHVVVPLNPPAPWDRAHAFAEALAQTLAARSPQHYVAVAGEKNRKDRIFIDYLRNARGATSIANYSLRARERASVAMPIDWNELRRIPSADAFGLRDVPGRLKRRRRDPWQGIDTVKQTLPSEAM